MNGSCEEEIYDEGGGREEKEMVRRERQRQREIERERERERERGGGETETDRQRSRENIEIKTYTCIFIPSIFQHSCQRVNKQFDIVRGRGKDE